MLDAMPIDQFNEWCAKDRIEPIGHGTRMLGLLAYMLASYLSPEKVDSKAFLPWLTEKPQIDNMAAKTLLSGLLGKPKEELI
jgi:hypothetical protein